MNPAFAADGLFEYNPGRSNPAFYFFCNLQGPFNPLVGRSHQVHQVTQSPLIPFG